MIWQVQSNHPLRTANCNQITEHVVDNNVNPYNKTALHPIRQVNRAFYRSATRLLLQNVEFTLQRSSPHIPLEFDTFSQGENAHYVRKVSIRDSSILLDQPYRTADLSSRTREISTVLARFPGLEKVSISCRRRILRGDNRDPHASRALAVSICEGLPKDLKELSLHHLSTRHIHILSQSMDSSPCILSSLQSFTFKSTRHAPGRVSSDEVLLALRNAPNLKELSLSSTGRLRYGAIHKFITGRDIPPLRRLKLDRIALPATALPHLLFLFRHTLQDLCLHNVWLERYPSIDSEHTNTMPGAGAGTDSHTNTSTYMNLNYNPDYIPWAYTFDLLSTAFPNLTTLRVAQCKLPPILPPFGQTIAVLLPPWGPHTGKGRTANAFRRCIAQVETNRARLGRPSPEWERVCVWHPHFESSSKSATDQEYIARAGARAGARGRGRKGRPGLWTLYSTFRRYSIGRPVENGTREFKPEVFAVFTRGCASK